ncbi:PREDICTED: uncharacterized protein LOC106805559 isoform X2 [Priapulus caudatus]|uniref:Uncharacterized protein LOC106805559 isoform X2 n=1 Tax=Priapulus caudatus TaxID=37621 RepID=A0ABM1DRX1_PRICU|nr:PREDICTED: uncharacterized protein LOC106805559 isoform X2 [Priapulus caudatus]
MARQIILLLLSMIVLSWADEAYIEHYYTTTEEPYPDHYTTTEYPDHHDYETTTYDPWLPEEPEDNKLVDVDVNCDIYDHEMKVKLGFEHGFDGVVYTRNHYGDSSCRVSGDGTKFVHFDISMEKCGTTNKAMSDEEYASHRAENVIVIMKKDWGFLDGLDEFYTVRCEFSGMRARTVNYDLAVPLSHEVSTLETATVALPSCWMQIVKGKDPLDGGTSELNLGDTATLVVYLHDSYYFDLSVSNCYAYDRFDHYGGKHTTVDLINDDGCSANKRLVGEPIHTRKLQSGQTAWFFHFRAFRFPDEENVYFQCQCNVCYHNCYQPTCNGDRVHRYKREAVETDINAETARMQAKESEAVREEWMCTNSVTIMLRSNPDAEFAGSGQRPTKTKKSKINL